MNKGISLHLLPFRHHCLNGLKIQFHFNDMLSHSSIIVSDTNNIKNLEESFSCHFPLKMFLVKVVLELKVLGCLQNKII